MHNMEKELHEYFQEQIVWLFFQLSRKKDFIAKLHLELHCKLFLRTLKRLTNENKDDWTKYLHMYLRCIAFCRDTYIGLGEKDLFYNLIFSLHEYYPRHAKYLLCCIVHSDEDRMIGCWRDLPYLCDYIYHNSSLRDKHPLIVFSIYLINDQLDKDLYTWKYSYECFDKLYISNVCKHIPREKSKHDWLYTKLCTYWIQKHKPYILQTPKTLDSYNRALKKCKKLYRKNVSYLHKCSEGFVIQMTKKNYDQISSKNISVDNFMHHHDFFLGFDFQSSDKHKLQDDYFLYLKNWMNDNKVEKKHYFHGHSHCPIPLGYLVKRAIYNIKIKAEENREIHFLNSYWKQFVQKKNTIDFFLPLLDVSNTINNDSFYASLAISLYISQVSKISNCIVAMDKFPTWISIPESLTFYEKVSIVLESIHNLQNNICNYQKAIQLIIHTLKETNVNELFIKNMKLLIFSEFENSIISEKDIEIMFSSAGFMSFPKIVYWNFSQNKVHDIPCNIHSKQTSLYSGFSKSQAHNVIYMNKKHNFSTYDTVLSILNQKRYDFICDLNNPSI